MLVKTAKEFGVVSRGNTKMPGTTYAMDPNRCTTGGKLRESKGSVCSKCYACKLTQLRPSVRKGWATNHDKTLTAIDADMAGWVDAIVFQIDRAGATYHRWHDAGDLQSQRHLRAIVEVAKRMPHVMFWLPTKEVKIVRGWYMGMDPLDVFPENLVVRVSAPRIDQAPLAFPLTSTVHSKGNEGHGHVCPARTQGNACGDCRACWDRTVANVSYPLH